jgi:hypothetical protein
MRRSLLGKQRTIWSRVTAAMLALALALAFPRAVQAITLEALLQLPFESPAT